MSDIADDLKRRTKNFTLDILKFVRTLPDTDEARDIGRQLRRAGTGTGSNYRATCRSRSRTEFVARIGVALEEADESGFWLEVIVEAKISTSREAYRLLEEANQISAILAQSSRRSLNHDGFAEDDLEPHSIPNCLALCILH